LRKVEGSLGFFPGASLRFARAFVRFDTVQVLDRQRNLHRRRYDLHRLPILHFEVRAQHLVPAQQRVQRVAQRRRIELARHPQHLLDVVGRTHRHQPVEQP
jgi:hypothetical protein